MSAPDSQLNASPHFRLYPHDELAVVADRGEKTVVQRVPRNVLHDASVSPISVNRLHFAVVLGVRQHIPGKKDMRCHWHEAPQKYEINPVLPEADGGVLGSTENVTALDHVPSQTVPVPGREHQSAADERSS